MRRGGINWGFLVAAGAVIGTGIPFILIAVVLLTGWTDLGGAQNTFNPSGEVARDQRFIFLVVMWPALVIGVGVFLALAYIVIRYQRKGDDEPPPKQVHGNTRLEIGWTVAPTLLLAVLAVPTIMGIIDLGKEPGDEAFRVNVTAFRFGWNFDYLSTEGESGEPIAGNACGEIDVAPAAACVYVPIDRDIAFTLESLDVNHSFWIPRLGGKQDAIPGHTNRLWLRADETGVFAGQCAELCGTGHAGMRMAIVALEEADLDACLQALDAGAEDLSVCNPEASVASEPPEESS